MAYHVLRNSGVIEFCIVLDRCGKLLGMSKSGLLQHLLDPTPSSTVESLDHAIGLRVAWLGESMLDVVIEAVGELFAFVGEHLADFSSSAIVLRSQRFFLA